jgi:hypothetical protein
MNSYAIQRIIDLERAVEKLKVSQALNSSTTYTIDWIRDQLEADPSFYAWITTSLESDASFYSWLVTSLESDASFYAWFVGALETDVSFYSWIVTSLQSDVAFYNWFRDALEADATFISSLVTSFTSNLAFTNWITNTATYSSESFITLRRTATDTFTAGVRKAFTWQSIVRQSNNGTQFQTPFVYTPPSASIVIPQSGYYTIAFSGYSDVNSTKQFFLSVNGNPNVINTNDNQAASRFLYFNITNYFDIGDTIILSLTASVNIVLAVNAEKGSNQSPFLQIVRVNAAG